ncbi:MFS transporter [Pelagicoccus sp. SDUM812003]|uniref:MFS transporter n=1 Tax=Pelagicoccus sp. SDUM812003 TaxID=3041267 RepID=UPI0028103156|nr:MFS transporter [Pelagicoccus sp. SDUM812003]MDQ8205020.1 MFS transporter [Pelagicoccus sp. SDUM812003]
MLESDTPSNTGPKGPMPRGEGEDRATKEEDKVSLGEKTALGSGYLSLFFGNMAVNSLAMPVYNMTLHVSPILLGTALSIPRLWDAITDPAVGYISDNLHTRWGRRRPLIVLGAILQAIAFGMIWMVPMDWGEKAMAGYLLGSLLFFYTCYTIFGVPLTSLTFEMTPDYKERTRVTSFCGFFHKIGELGYSWLFPLATLSVFGSVMYGVRFVGWAVAILLLGLVGILPGIFVKERYYKVSKKQKKVKFWSSAAESLRNKAFAVLVALTICQIVAGMFASSTDYYLIVYYMFDGDIAEGSHWKAVLSTGYAIVGIVSIYPINWLSNRYGKKTALNVIFAMVLLGSIGKWVLYTPGNPWKILIDPLLCGPIWTAIAVLLPSMVADICDDDELKHGQRREGMFGSVFLWIQKVGYSLSIFGMTIALQVSGFDAELGGDQSSESILTLRLFLAVSTALWAILAIVILIFYPITRQRAYETRDALEERRGTV